MKADDLKCDLLMTQCRECLADDIGASNVYWQRIDVRE
jgi:hypothetical protein